MTSSRCPACSATVRPDAEWCSLCYLDLRPEPQPAPARMQAPATSAVPVAPRSSPDAAPSPAVAPSEAVPSGAAGWPCTSCSAVVPLDLAACPHCGAAFLGRLAGDGGRHRAADSSIGRLPRAVRLGAGLAVGILIAVLVPILLALVG